MPTATSFKALGAGNGFPFCLDKVDVSSYDYWTTLGGYNKNSVGAVTQQQIDTSLSNAMALFWNIYKLNATGAGFGGVGGGPFGSTAGANIVDHGSLSDPEPKGRVCSVGGIIFNATYEGGIEVEGVQVSFLFLPIRMYNGLTTDEANFVGYGGKNSSIGGQFTNPIAGVSAFAEVDNEARVYAASYLNEDATEYPVGFASDSDYAYVQVSGIPFVVEAIAFQGSGAIPPDGTATASASGLSASAVSGPTGFGSASCNLGELDFYTY